MSVFPTVRFTAWLAEGLGYLQYWNFNRLSPLAEVDRTAGRICFCEACEVLVGWGGLTPLTRPARRRAMKRIPTTKAIGMKPDSRGGTRTTRAAGWCQFRAALRGRDPPDMATAQVLTESGLSSSIKAIRSMQRCRNRRDHTGFEANACRRRLRRNRSRPAPKPDR